MLMRSQVHAAIVADLLEEGWPSMDLMAEMLMAHAPRDESGLRQTLWRPAFNRKAPALITSRWD